MDGKDLSHVSRNSATANELLRTLPQPGSSSKLRLCHTSVLRSHKSANEVDSSANFEKRITTCSNRCSILAPYSPHIAQHGANSQHVLGSVLSHGTLVTATGTPDDPSSPTKVSIQPAAEDRLPLCSLSVSPRLSLLHPPYTR
jgi:hypothetical protein